MDDRLIQNNTIKAVYSSDLEELLSRRGLAHDFNVGNIRCKYCNKVISERNLFALMPEDGTVSFICDSPECTEKMMIAASEDNDIEENKNQ